MSDTPVTDLTVSTHDPDLLDDTVQALPMCAAVVVADSYSRSDGTCIVRVFGNAEFLKFALSNQGYGEVLSEVRVQ